MTKFTLQISHDPKIVHVDGDDFPKKLNVCVHLLMVCHVCIRPVHNIGKELVISLRGYAG